MRLFFNFENWLHVQVINDILFLMFLSLLWFNKKYFVKLISSEVNSQKMLFLSETSCWLKHKFEKHVFCQLYICLCSHTFGFGQLIEFPRSDELSGNNIREYVKSCPRAAQKFVRESLISMGSSLEYYRAEHWNRKPALSHTKPALM